MRTIKHRLVLTVLLSSAALAPLSACSDAANDNATSTTHTALSSGLVVKTALTLSSAVASAGQTVQASVTYENDTGAPLVVNGAAIAARPPGGSHAGGPYADFTPYASARTLAAGETITVSASRAFTAADAKGSWDLYTTWQDGAGAWHDGPDTTLAVGDVAPCATPPSNPPGNGAPPSSGPPLIDAPIAGATAGSWQSGSIDGMSYQLLLPAGYSSAHAYPLVLYLHQLDNASQIPAQIDPWFNDPDFRSKHPAIIVAPQCNQDADPSGQTINWGGVSGDPQPCQEHAIALVGQLMTTYSVYAPKVYVTGNSMGGIGSWDLIFKYNTKNPTVRPLFAAALILAGATYAWGYPNPDPSLVARVKDVPIWSIHGGGDTQVPLAWDQNMYAAEQSIGGAMRLLVDPALGHDVWDTYYVMPRAETYWSWLFAQSK